MVSFFEIFVCVLCTHLSVYITRRLSVHKGLEEGIGSLDLELQAIVSGLMQVVGTEFKSSTRILSALSC